MSEKGSPCVCSIFSTGSGPYLVLTGVSFFPCLNTHIDKYIQRILAVNPIKYKQDILPMRQPTAADIQTQDHQTDIRNSTCLCRSETE